MIEGRLFWFAEVSYQKTAQRSEIALCSVSNGKVEDHQEGLCGLCSKNVHGTRQAYSHS